MKTLYIIESYVDSQYDYIYCITPSTYTRLFYRSKHSSGNWISYVDAISVQSGYFNFLFFTDAFNPFARGEYTIINLEQYMADNFEMFI